MLDLATGVYCLGGMAAPPVWLTGVIVCGVGKEFL